MSAQRPQISPNAGFMACLIRLEESLHGTKTVKARPHTSLSTQEVLVPCVQTLSF